MHLVCINRMTGFQEEEIKNYQSGIDVPMSYSLTGKPMFYAFFALRLGTIDDAIQNHVGKLGDLRCKFWLYANKPDRASHVATP